MPAVFVTATGTDVGKTFVTVGLIEHWRSEARRVAALKPVVSGFGCDAMADSDPARLLRALGREVDDAAISEISPWRFAAPLSPDMAARHEGRSIDFDQLVGFCRRAIAEADDILIIEGNGGLMVPLDAQSTILDLVAELAIPIILVAGTYLGTLSHALTALAAACRRAVEIRTLVLDETPGSPCPIEEVAATLQSFFASAPILALRRGPAAENQAIFAHLARLCFERKTPEFD